MSSHTRAMQSNLVMPEVALLLIRLQVWIPAGILQSSFTDGDGKRHNLQQMTEARYRFRREFWIKVLGDLASRQSAEANHEIVKDLLKNFKLWSLPKKEGFGSVTGLAFEPDWYHNNTSLAKRFFQVLQSRIAGKEGRWSWHLCGEGEWRIKILEVTGI